MGIDPDNLRETKIFESGDPLARVIQPEAELASWGRYGNNPQALSIGSGTVPEEEPTDEEIVTVADEDVSDNFLYQPISDGEYIIGSRENNDGEEHIFSFDIEERELLWEINADVETEETVNANGCAEGPNGELLFNSSFAGPIAYALDPDDGSVLWELKTGDVEDISSFANVSLPAVYRGDLILGVSSDKDDVELEVFGIDVEDGSILYRVETDNSDDDMFGRMPTIIGDDVFLATGSAGDIDITKFSFVDGEVNVEQIFFLEDAGMAQLAAEENGLLYHSIGSRDPSVITAIDPDDGSTVWERSAGDGDFESPDDGATVTLFPEERIVFCFDGSARYGFDMDDGTVLYEIQERIFPGEGNDHALCIDEESGIAVTNDYGVEPPLKYYGIDVTDGSVVWDREIVSDSEGADGFGSHPVSVGGAITGTVEFEDDDDNTEEVAQVFLDVEE